MRALLLISLLALCACASKPYHERVPGGARTNFDEAANDCEVKQSVAVRENGANDWGVGFRRKRFFKQCMSGQGYVQD